MGTGMGKQVEGEWENVWEYGGTSERERGRLTSRERGRGGRESEKKD